MAKGYIIVDIPEGCDDCQLCTYEGDVNSHMGFFCDGTLDNGFGFTKIPDDIVYNGLKPDWCPIKELPEELLKPKFKPNYKIPTYFEKYISQTRSK